MPVVERQRETETSGPASPRGSRITGRIQAMPGPERVLTWPGEPVKTQSSTHRNRRTSWTPWRHRPPARRKAAGGPSLWRTDRRTTSPTGCRSTGAGRGRRTASAAADLHGVAGGGPDEGPEPAEVNAPVPRQRAVQRAAGDGGQRWPQDGGHRRAVRCCCRIQRPSWPTGYSTAPSRGRPVSSACG